METPQKKFEKKQPNLLKIFWTSLPILFLISIIILILFLFSVVKSKQEALTEAQKNSAAIERPAVNIIVLEVNPAEIRDVINLPGFIEPWTDLKLLSKIYGSVIEVPVAEGDFINKGDVIARIDPLDYQFAVDAARSAYNLAIDDYKRTKTLFEKKLTPKAELDRLQSTAKIQKAELDKAELQLSRCTIEAPIPGVIRTLDVKPGLLLSIADPVAHLLQTDSLKAVVGIPESDVSAVQTIDAVSVHINAFDNKIVETKKHFLSPSPENKAMLYRLELAMANPDQKILPGMFIRAEIVKKVVSQGLSVPLYAVITRDKEQFVFIEQDGTAVKKNVELGILEGWRIQVVKGLEPGNRVIIEGHRSVEEGQKVNVVRSLTHLETSI